MRKKKSIVTWVSDWSAKNYQEVQIYLRGHIEGTFIQQTKELATQYNSETGETRAEYKMGALESYSIFHLHPRR